MTPRFHRAHFVELARRAQRKGLNELKTGSIGQAKAYFAERDVQMSRARGKEHHYA